MVLRSMAWRPGAGELEGEILEELSLHLDLATQDLIAAGMDPAQARRAAEERFGDFGAVLGACREVKLEDRILMKRTLLFLVALLSIAVVVQAYQLREARVETARAIEDVHDVLSQVSARFDAALLLGDEPGNSQVSPPSEGEWNRMARERADASLPAAGGGPGAVERHTTQAWARAVTEGLELKPAHSRYGASAAKRFEAVSALAKSPHPDAGALLIRALGDPDVFVRMAAVNALAARGEVSALPALTGLAEGDSNEAVRDAAAAAVESIEPPKQPPVGTEEAWLDAVTKGLEMKPAHPAYSAAAAERFEAVCALGQSDHPRAAEALIGALNDPDVFVRVAAIQALVARGEIRATGELLRLASEDSNAAVRAAAVEALGGVSPGPDDDEPEPERERAPVSEFLDSIYDGF